MIKYSIIIPHHNSQDSLIRCINSIPDKESVQIIVVDDCSNREKVDFNYIKLAAKREFELYRLESNQGAGAARNEGLKHTKGEWILFSDADDYFVEGIMSVLEEAIQNHDNDIIYFNLDEKNNRSLQGERYKSFIDAYNGTTKSQEDVKYRTWSPWAKLFRKDFIDKSHLYFEPRKKGNDCFFVLNAAAKANVISVVNKPLYHLSYSPKSLSHTHNTDWKYMKDVYDLWLWRYRFFKNNGIEIWKEYNVMYVLKEVYKTFRLKGAIEIIRMCFRYKYNPISILMSKIVK